MPPRAASPHVQRLAKQLLALPKAELEQVRKECRERLIPKPSFASSKAMPKTYDPKLKRLRSDCPLSVRQHLATVGHRMGAVHPAYIFAGAGPCILPSQVPALSMAVMAPHWANMPEMAPGPPGPELPALEATAQEEAEAEAPQEAPTAKPTKKASVTLRLVGFETAKKIAVVKEVRSMLGEGLKESKEKVESAPVNLKKGVPLEDGIHRLDIRIQTKTLL